MKREKGITLIALIITIIIMLLLLAVTVSVAFGENGLIARAKNAGDRWKEEQEREVALGDDNDWETWIGGEIKEITPPTGEVTYSTLESTSNPVTATMKTSKEIVTPNGWTKVDSVHYTREYTMNVTETIIITDLFGKEGTVDIKINNIETTMPTGMASYSPDTATVGSVTVTIKTNKQVQTPAGWTFVTTQEFTKVYTENKTEDVTITDFASNTGTVNVEVTNIRTEPESYTGPNSDANPYYEYKVTVAGYYILEVAGAVGGRGAQGLWTQGVGSPPNIAVTTYGMGGNGGYMNGRVYLEVDDILKIYVGAVGNQGSSSSSTGGAGGKAVYNGGESGKAGKSYTYTDENVSYLAACGGGGGSGGGKTHISLSRGESTITILTGNGGGGGSGARGTTLAPGGAGGLGGGGTAGGAGTSSNYGNNGGAGSSSYNSTYVTSLSATNGANAAAGYATIAFESTP